MRIISIGMVSVLLLGASLNLAAADDPDFAPGPWGELKSVSKYPSDGPVKLATRLYNSYGGMPEGNIPDASEDYAAQKQQVAADTDAGIDVDDTMTERIKKTGELVGGENPTEGGASIYAQVIGVNNALGGTDVDTLTRVGEVAGHVGDFEDDDVPEDFGSVEDDLNGQVLAAISAIKFELQRVADGGLSLTPGVSDDQYTSLTTLKDISNQLKSETT